MQDYPSCPLAITQLSELVTTLTCSMEHIPGVQTNIPVYGSKVVTHPGITLAGPSAGDTNSCLCLPPTIQSLPTFPHIHVLYCWRYTSFPRRFVWSAEAFSSSSRFFFFSDTLASCFAISLLIDLSLQNFDIKCQDKAIYIKLILARNCLPENLLHLGFLQFLWSPLLLLC